MFFLLRQILRVSISSLLANKVRSFLTMSGIIIGVGAVIVIMSVGAGAQSLILAQVKSLGTNLIGILPGKSEKKGPPATVMGIVITTLTYNDAMAIEKDISDVNGVVAYSKSAGTVSWSSNSYQTNLSGCTTGYLKVEDGKIASGRFFTKQENQSLARVVVLGYTVKKELFGPSPAINQHIKIKNHTFTVIGVMAKRGTVAFQDYDDQVFIPLKTEQKIISGINYVNLVRIKVDNKKNIDQVMHNITLLLRQRHGITDQSGANDDFTIRSAAEALDMITNITDALKYFLAAMAALSLIVGGIGIMNIMLVSVSERTREIGLRKAVGANNFSILIQFLLEAVTVTMIGGLIGIVGGIFISFLIATGAHFLKYDWNFEVSFLSIILAVGVSTLVGLVFGIYPANKASRLEPAEALNYE